MELAWNNLSDAIFEHAVARPSAPALIEGEVTISYAKLADLVGKASVYLHGLGIQPAEVVAVALPSSIDHVVLAFALMRIGAVPLDLPAQRPPGAFVDPIRHFKVRRAFLIPQAPDYPDVICHRVEPRWRAMIETNLGDRRQARDQDEMHFLSLTSGSTGAPKGIVTTQRQWLARTRSAMKLFPEVLTPEHPPKLLLVGGIGFSAFFFFLTNQICIGGPTVLMSESHRPDELVKAIAGWEDGACLITPPLCRQFLTMPATNGVLFPGLRALFVGAAPLFPEEKLQILERLTPNLYEVYGSAACGFVSALSPADVRDAADSVGKLAPDVWLEAADGAGATLPVGRIGHLRARGPGISKGLYVGDPATGGAEGFRDGWYYPGDVGTIDDAGFIRLMGRIADLIHRRGLDIFAPEIEQVVQSHPSIVEAAAVGAPATDGSADERLIVFAIPRGEPATDQIARYCRERIPQAKFPDRVYFVRGLPKTPNGKVDRSRLRRMASEGPGGSPPG